jgi:hypothetical protein
MDIKNEATRRAIRLLQDTEVCIFNYPSAYPEFNEKGISLSGFIDFNVIMRTILSYIEKCPDALNLYDTPDSRLQITDSKVKRNKENCVLKAFFGDTGAMLIADKIDQILSRKNKKENKKWV